MSLALVFTDPIEHTYVGFLENSVCELNLQENVESEFSSQQTTPSQIDFSTNHGGAYASACGFVSNSLSLAAKHQSAHQEVLVDLQFMELYLSSLNSSPVQMPFGMQLFSGVETIPPYSEVFFWERKLIVKSSLLQASEKFSSKLSLVQAIKSAQNRLFFMESGAVMFSGGKDSVLLALGLRQFSSNAPDNIYVRQDIFEPGLDLNFTRQVANFFELPLKVLPDSKYPMEYPTQLLAFEKNLKHRFLGITDYQYDISTGYKYLVVGQNVDSMLSAKVLKPPQSGWLTQSGYFPFLLHRFAISSPHISVFQQYRILERGLRTAINIVRFLSKRPKLPPYSTNFHNHVAALNKGLDWGLNSSFSESHDEIWEEAALRLVNYLDLSEGMPTWQKIRVAWFYLHPGQANVLMSTPNANGISSVCIVNEPEFLGFWLSKVPISSFFRKTKIERAIFELSGRKWPRNLRYQIDKSVNETEVGFNFDFLEKVLENFSALAPEFSKLSDFTSQQLETSKSFLSQLAQTKNSEVLKTTEFRQHLSMLVRAANLNSILNFFSNQCIGKCV